MKPYLKVQNFLPLDICNIATKYALIKKDVEFQPEDAEFSQVPGSHSVYADTLMETLLFFSKEHVEKYTGLELEPTYSYYRVYRPGDKLDIHTDRPSCEISCTLCLGYHYITDDKDYNWPIFVEGNKFKMSPGDGVIYRGCDVAHWRDPFDVEEGSYQVQAFLHYVDKNGPHAEWKYDKRKCLGASLDERCL